MAHVNDLLPLAPGTEPDHTVWATANPFHRKSCHGRYAMAYLLAVRPQLAHQPLALGLPTRPFTVIDAPTGSGIGAAYLHEQLAAAAPGQANVIGLDINDAAIEAARRTYPGPHYLAGDLIATLDPINGSADVIVCMEYLEHVSAAQARDSVAAIHAALRPGGTAVFTTPRHRPREHTVARDHHIHEFYDEEFYYLIEEHFPLVQRLSFDRYANAIHYTADANLMVAIAHTWPATEVFA